MLHVVVPFVLVVAQATAQTPPRDAQRPGGAPASVSGRVSEAGTGRPLRRIVVRFHFSGGSGSFETTTGADGRYALSGLHAGEYFATASPDEFGAGHLPRTFGQADSTVFVRPPTVELKPGEQRQNMDFVLARAFAVEGRVLNEYGEPMAELMTSVERVDRPGASRSRQTDDRGEFRLFGLAPGSWRVCAAPEPSGFDRPTTGATLLLRYVKTCAAPVSIKDADVTGVVIQMQRERGYTMSGVVVDAAGAPVLSANLAVERVDGSGRSSAAPVEFNRGAFVVRGLTSGDYAVVAQIEEPRDQYAPLGSFAAPRQVGVASVRIDAGDVGGVVVSVTPGGAASGRIRWNGTPVPSIKGSRLNIFTRRDSASGRQYNYLPTPSAPVNDDLTFELKPLHGPIIVGVSGAPSGWIVESVRLGDRDITHAGTEFKPAAEGPPIEVTLTNRTAEVIARAVDETGKPVVEAMVFLGPADRRQWRPERVTATPPLKDGTVKIGRRLPGDYLIVAMRIEQLAMVKMRTSEELQALAGYAQPVTLVEGQPAAVDVRIARLPEVR